ncbi:ABC transporter ATP-binding protein [Cellulomonas bogoriensis]|uniref:Iron ABC transporter n=1 Tax=Cellulomonas bogoriensis 69B4 = DSM 16987 TaxID=1386082 RepID=A0A0A0BMB4_9CELL|nr:ABC transporter ATP-binding protein [Cellulomonas bogoriensis]KGM08827.1 iron ABC transporter [Cellulomonas bogoriensis 69B4 = DSM 16987]
MLRVEDVSFAYGDHQVLDRVGFELGTHELCALFGPNGTGKSTLFRCILGHLSRTGRVHVDGNDTSRMTAGRLARLVAYVPQEHRPPFPYRVRDMVLMGRTPHLGGVFGPGRRDQEVADAAMERIGVAHLADRSYTTLSGGQRQLVLLARALAQETPVLLLDEPTAALDFGNQLLLWQTVRSLTAEGRTALICTHDPNHVLWFCHRALVLGRDGRLVADGRVADVVDDELVTDLYGPVSEVAAHGQDRVVLPLDRSSLANRDNPGANRESVLNSARR